MENELNFNVLKLSFEEKEQLRKKIVRQMKKHGDTKEVAAICECSQRHVQSTWKKYKEGGVEAIKTGKIGSPKGVGAKLALKEQDQVIKLITDKNPDQLKLKGFLWDRKLVSELVKRLFGKVMPLSTMGLYLQKWGFTASTQKKLCGRKAEFAEGKFTEQRPKKKHYKQNDEAVRQWLGVTYPEISKSAKEEKAEIYWIDETGIHNTTNYVKGYSPKGITPTIPFANEHIRINMISAITNKGKLRFHFYKEKMNQQIFIAFLQRLIKSTNKKVYAIADNLKTHHGNLVKDFVLKNSDKIAIFHLPSYAPELNPDEYLNHNLKQETAKKGYSETADEVMGKAMGTMRSIQNNKTRVSDFFDKDEVQYAKE